VRMKTCMMMMATQLKRLPVMIWTRTFMTEMKTLGRMAQHALMTDGVWRGGRGGWFLTCR
jgi:hypothetical protein